MMSAEFESANF